MPRHQHKGCDGNDMIHLNCEMPTPLGNPVAPPSSDMFRKESQSTHFQSLVRGETKKTRCSYENQKKDAH